MSCYHPKYARNVAEPGSLKAQLQFASRCDDSFVYFRSDLSRSYKLPLSDDRLLRVPCGKCLGCTLDYSRSWADRCCLEMLYHDESWFLTLTYDDEHLPRTYSADWDTGEIIAPVATLVKRDFQLFVKRLRKAYGDGIRYFAAGEYGSKTLRPHYHAIFFGLHLDDLQLVGRTPLGDELYQSPKLNRTWSDINGYPIGYVTIGKVTWASCAYVARYVVKKSKGQDKRWYESMNMQPEFTLMSRAQGIGKQYYLDHPELWDFNFINLSTETGGRKITPPDYFFRLLEQDNPERYRELKNKRKSIAISLEKLKKDLTNLNEYDRLTVEEQVKAHKIKILKRDVL